MLRLIFQNSDGRRREDNLSMTLKTFEVACPELEKLLVALKEKAVADGNPNDGLPLTLLDVEVFTPPPKPVVKPPEATPESQDALRKRLIAKFGPKVANKIVNPPQPNGHWRLPWFGRRVEAPKIPGPAPGAKT